MMQYLHQQYSQKYCIIFLYIIYQKMMFLRKHRFLNNSIIFNQCFLFPKLMLMLDVIILVALIDYLAIPVILIIESTMQDNILHFGKEIFVSIKKENINNYYEVAAKELGKGAFGTVYKGRVKGSEGPWRAIKKIPRAAIKDPAMLMNEIEISMELDNPNIIKLYEIYEFNNSVYMVSDLCEGGQLFDRLDQKGCLSENDARIIFRQMVEGINYLHLNKIAHRDLKPENFLFLKQDSNNIKLIDFGLAKKWDVSLNKQLKAKNDKKIVGTSYYLAPEILEHDYDERCDIWSLGVILYILITAAPPFDGENDKQILQSVKNMKYSMNIPEFNGVSNEAKDLISKILQPKDKRIKIKDIFSHPWMNVDLPKVALKISFRKMHEFSKFSKLKKLTATFVASQMSEKQVEKLGQLFRKIDINHDGYISIEELKIALAEQSAIIELKELKHLMDSIDIDGNGKINYTQFLASSLSKEELFTSSNLLKMFKMLDKDGNGQIDRAQLQKLFADNQVTHMNGKSIEEIIATCDKDKSGTIDFEEFKLAIMQ